jgi:hypothetical protein
VTVRVYDVLGKEVATLVDEGNMSVRAPRGLVERERPAERRLLRAHARGRSITKTVTMVLLK